MTEIHVLLRLARYDVDGARFFSIVVNAKRD